MALRRRVAAAAARGGRRHGRRRDLADPGRWRGPRRAPAAEIAQRGGKACRIGPHEAPAAAAATLNPEKGEDYARLIQEAGPLAGVVSLWPLRVPALAPDDLPSAGQRFGTDAALMLLQALSSNAAVAGAPRVWFVTAGSRGRRHRDAAHRAGSRGGPGASGLQRAPRPARDPGRSRSPGAARRCSLAGRRGARRCRGNAGRPAQGRSMDGPSGALVAAQRAARGRCADPPQHRRARNAREPDDRAGTQAFTRARPVEIRVRASGLNFRDVLSALGMYPGEIRHLGSDCAGEITAVGEGVTQFAVGDRVVAMVEGAFASHALARWEFVAPLPSGLDFEQGAAIPTAYLTADITLNLLGGMKRGDKVLIHSGAGGVGMAAIALAHRVGAEVFATAGGRRSAPCSPGWVSTTCSTRGARRSATRSCASRTAAASTWC
ncbi:hypothetical protein FSC37_09570 [Piscinibacter aquaticus]|uniref:Enoyl reductase (ER) domain-containing protein n=1 Tax=Piscinibacter aquaticus TaxID=392597 RepID=A0A5C6U2T6_9BURK|nr:hypothetical protein FSC37_09570 [Piscinibacter aquaticus]